MTAQNQRGEETTRQVRLAEFRIVGPGASGEPIPVHFNPDTLEYTVTNNIKEQGNSTESKQQVSKSSAKLSMELIFDTTLDGADVREKTELLQALMKPTEEGDEMIAPVVEFAWGTYRFKGIFTSYKETLDFFSPTGVPLRASISIAMTQQDGLFDPTAKGDAVDVDDSEGFSPGGAEDDEENTNRGPATGDPETDRGLAEDNGEENPRFFSGRELSLPQGPNLQPPAAFASGGLSLGLSGGLDLEAGIDVGFSSGVSAGVGIGLGVEAGIDVGLSASFDLDIGIGIELEATVDVGVDLTASGLEGGPDAGAGAAAGIGATSVVGSSPGTAPGSAAPRSASTGGGVFSADAGGGSGASGGFASGVYQNSAPDAPVRRRVRVDGGRDDLVDDLVMGPRYGGAASAGIPAAMGAFAGLRPVGPRKRRPLLLSKLKAQRPERQLRTDVAASFEIGGRALDRSPSGLGADVGARATLNDRIAFDDAHTEG